MATHLIQIDPGNPDRSTLRAIARRIVRGEICVLPTDTIYGFHCRADNSELLSQLHRLKGRQEEKPFLLLIQGVEYLAHREINLPQAARGLMERFWPGPLTLVLTSRERWPDALSEDGYSIAVRQPGYPILNRIIDYAGVPLASTSANLAGQEPLQTVEEIIAAFGDGVDCVLDAGLLPSAKPSTIVSFRTSPPSIVREGSIPAGFIEPFLNAPPTRAFPGGAE
jgi:L-threonylcarbamoyladenylate synthase